MGPKPVWPLTLKEGGRHCEDRDAGRRQSLGTEAEAGGMLPEAGIAGGHQNWEARDNSTQSLRGSVALLALERQVDSLSHSSRACLS